MAKRIEPATWGDRALVLDAIRALRHARERMKAARCPKAAEAIRIALKSAEGAERHVQRRAHETGRI